MKEFCVFAANYLWPERTMVGEKLVLVLHPEAGKTISDDTIARISPSATGGLLNYKRVSGYLVWDADFPLHRFAEDQARDWRNRFAKALSREAVVPL